MKSGNKYRLALISLIAFGLSGCLGDENGSYRASHYQTVPVENIVVNSLKSQSGKTIVEGPVMYDRLGFSTIINYSLRAILNEGESVEYILFTDFQFKNFDNVNMKSKPFVRTLNISEHGVVEAVLIRRKISPNDSSVKEDFASVLNEDWLKMGAEKGGLVIRLARFSQSEIPANYIKAFLSAVENEKRILKNQPINTD